MLSRAGQLMQPSQVLSAQPSRLCSGQVSLQLCLEVLRLALRLARLRLMVACPLLPSGNHQPVEIYLVHHPPRCHSHHPSLLIDPLGFPQTVLALVQEALVLPLVPLDNFEVLTYILDFLPTSLHYSLI